MNIQPPYQECSRCVMDTTDKKIFFDEKGICNHCNEFDNITSARWFPNNEGKKKLKTIFNNVKKEGKNKEYDCIIGLSGGVDSSYLALVLKEYELRPLVVHVDAGWNSELAVHNIEQIVKYCGYDLYTHVLNWKEVKDLQVSFLKAGIANQDTVQDHGFFASLYHFAIKNKIKYVISGGNISTESVFPSSWHHSAMDEINLKGIHKKFGKEKLVDYKTISFFKYFFYYPFVKGMQVIRPLNYIPYDKSEALKSLINIVGYKEYGRKHGESRFTKFFQNYYLPKKFNMDKRRPHLSSLILSNQISKDKAKKELEKPLYEEIDLKNDMTYVAKKLGLSEKELNHMIDSPGYNYSDYPNWDRRYKFMILLKNLIQKVLRRNVKIYS